MAGSGGTTQTITINRAPVLTLWAAVVAERLGYDRDEAVTLGRAVAGFGAAAKARSLRIAERREKPAVEKQAKAAKPGARVDVPLCGLRNPAIRTPDGLRSLSKDAPTAPAAVHRYLESRFGDALDDARAAMTLLAKSQTKEELAASAFALYESFRPEIPRGLQGWGAKGVLDLAKLRELVGQGRGRT